MVKSGSALGGVENTTGVHLEDVSVGLDGNGGWSNGDGSLKLINGLWSDVNVVLNENLTLGGISSTSLVNGLVWVVSLELLGGTLNVDESVLLPSTIASV